MEQSHYWDANISSSGQEIHLYENKRFITTFTRARRLPSLMPDESSSFPCLVSLRSVLIFFHLRLGLPSDVFTSGFPTRIVFVFISSPYVPHAQPISFPIWSPGSIWWDVCIKQRFITRVQCSPISCYFSLLGPNILSTPSSNTPSHINHTLIFVCLDSKRKDKRFWSWL